MLAHSSSIDLGVQAPGGVLACSQRLLVPSKVVSLVARMRSHTLDARLAAGADPASSAMLAARAGQLATPRSRARIATGLERMALRFDAPRSLFAILPERGAIDVNRDRLLGVAAILRSRRPLYAGGIAEARLIVVDGTGPAYTDRRGEGLARQLALAEARLTG